MIDLVTANEFTFTPSAFIAAYIEQETNTTVTETTANGGALNTLPKEMDNLTGNHVVHSIVGGSGVIQPDGTVLSSSASGLYANFTAVSGSVSDGSVTWSNPTFANQVQGNAAAYVPSIISKTGILSNTGVESFNISSSLVDIVGQEVLDTRTTSKTTTTSAGVAQTVVLVLSYGQFRAKCANAQTTVTLIYTRVSDYLNSLV